MPRLDGTPDARDRARGYMLGMNDTKVALRNGGGSAKVNGAWPSFGNQMRALSEATLDALRDYAKKHGDGFTWETACLTAGFCDGEILVNLWCDEVEAASAE